MLFDRFAGTPEDELLDRLVASPALAGPELSFLRARIAERRGDVSQAAALVARSLQELPGRQAYLVVVYQLASSPEVTVQIGEGARNCAGWVPSTWLSTSRFCTPSRRAPSRAASTRTRAACPAS